MKNWILPLNNETLNNSKEKHQESKDTNNTILLTSVSQRAHPKHSTNGFSSINNNMFLHNVSILYSCRVILYKNL